MNDRLQGRWAIFALLACISWTCAPGKKPLPTPPAPLGSYMEQHRPQFHFSPAAHWMNDPNGMVFYEGEYHFFYQYYPEKSVWGPMHWAHAVSKDLVHWEHLPIALYPDGPLYIFSGSAVVDWNNTSGLGTAHKPPLVAMYTIHDMDKEKAGRKDVESQGIAYSTDRGRSWTKFAQNPVLPNPGNVRDFRDPKLIWHEASNQWVVVMAAGDHAEIWGSPNLKQWKHLSDFGKELGAHGGVWECPDLFPINVENAAEQKWALIVNINPGHPNGGSGTQYFIGDFDGKNFIVDPHFAQSVPKGSGVWLDLGKDNYAGVTWSDVPKSDGRRLMIGWMSNWEYAMVVPTEVWRSAATLPRELLLQKRPEGYRLRSKPVKELESLRGTPITLANTKIDGRLNPKLPGVFPVSTSEWVLEFDLKNTKSVSAGIELSNSKGETYRIGYDLAKKQFFSDRTKAGDASFSKTFADGLHTAARVSTDHILRLHLYFDVSSAELFADDGSVSMTELYFPAEPFKKARIFSEGGHITLTRGDAYPLKRIWK